MGIPCNVSAQIPIPKSTQPPKSIPFPKPKPSFFSTPKPLPASGSMTDRLSRLPLFPDTKLAEALESDFRTQIAGLNTQIADKQIALQTMLSSWSSDVELIRKTQGVLSDLRRERDRLSLEHLLLMRQVREHFVIPARANPSPL